MTYRFIICLAAAVTLPLAACDCSGDEAPPARATTGEAQPLRVSTSRGDPVEAEGSVEADDGKHELLWKHAFDANHIVSASGCGEWFYAATAAGRLIRYPLGDATIEQVFDVPHSVSAVHGTDSELVVGTRDGRLARADCSLRGLKWARERTYEVAFVHRDARSEKRALVAFQKPKADTDTQDVINALVDLRTGNSTKRPFEFTTSEAAQLVHFVDYRGELWAGASSPRGSRLWYLERFDRKQPRIKGIGPGHDLRGLVQIGRTVWAYGGSHDSGDGFVSRVDSGNAASVWDGEKIASGQHAGGDVPTDRAVTLVIQQRDNVLVFTRDAVYQADHELRRWKRLAAAEDGNLFEDVAGWAKADDDVVVATSRGIAVVSGDRIRHEPHPRLEPTSGDATLHKSLEWKGHTFVASNEGLKVKEDGTAPARPVFSIKDPTHALLVDAEDRLWAVTDDDVVVADARARRPDVARFPVESIGLSVEAMTGLRRDERPDTIVVAAGDQGRFRLRLPTSEAGAVEDD